MSTSHSGDQNSHGRPYGTNESDPDPEERSTNEPDRHRGPEQTDLVSIMGVVTIIFGGLKFFCGVGVSFGLRFYSAALKQWVREMNWTNPEMVHSVFMIVVLAIAIFFLIIPGLLQVIGGFGVLKRRNWARVLLIVIGGIDVAFALPQLMGGNLVGFLLSGGWGAFTLYVLFSEPYKQEFFSGGEQ